MIEWRKTIDELPEPLAKLYVFFKLKGKDEYLFTRCIMKENQEFYPEATFINGDICEKPEQWAYANFEIINRISTKQNLIEKVKNES